VLEDVSTVSSVDVELLDPSTTGTVPVGDSLAARALAADGAGASASGASGAGGASVAGLPEPREPSMDRLATMAAFRLFAGLSREALAALSAAAELVEFVPGAMIIVRDEPAFALYAIIDGVARVTVRGSSGDVRLGEGDVFGEGCLLDEGTRQADVKAETPLMALRVGKEALDRVTKEHAQIGDALFQLLARRLLTNLLMTSPLFTLFEPKVRLELAQLFEVRRAEPGTILAERGRRSDGLYVLLAGNVMAKGESAAEIRIARGTAFGHGSLMGGAPALETVRVATEAVVLRLPAAAFASLAALYPPALAALSATADEPLPPSRLLE
jgi:CRP/FNR family transcriptional regulator